MRRPRRSSRRRLSKRLELGSVAITRCQTLCETQYVWHSRSGQRIIFQILLGIGGTPRAGLRPKERRFTNRRRKQRAVWKAPLLGLNGRSTLRLATRNEAKLPDRLSWHGGREDSRRGGRWR